MKANTDRTGRLNFDEAVDAYDEGRFEIPADLVGALCAGAGLGRGSRVLDVGAGTGQLTRALLAAGLVVTALEPGARLAERLRTKLGLDGSLAVETDLFEDFDPASPFDGIWSANAFHWLDPAVSYSKAADLLEPGGALVLMWNFPAVADPDLRSALAGVYGAGFRAYGNDIETLARDVAGVVEAGRDEIRASGRYEEPLFAEYRCDFGLTPLRYAYLLESQANGAVLPETEKQSLRAGVLAACESVGATTVRLDNVVYVSTARRL